MSRRPTALHRLRAAGGALLATALLGPFAIAPPRGLSAQSSEEYGLRITDRAGSESRYRLGFEMRMRAEYEGEAPPDFRQRQVLEALAPGITMRMNMVYTQKLEDISADSNRTFELRWHHYDFSGQVGDELVPPPPGHEASIRQLLSGAARVRTTPWGEAIEVEYDRPELARLGDNFRQMPGALPVYLPKDPVAVGDRWTGRVELPLEVPGRGMQGLSFTLEHTLRDVAAAPDGPVAVIDVAGTYSSMDRGASDVLGSMHLQATITGSARFDVNAGWFASGAYEIDMYAVDDLREGELRFTGHASGNLERVEGR